MPGTLDTVIDIAGDWFDTNFDGTLHPSHRRLRPPGTGARLLFLDSVAVDQHTIQSLHQVMNSTPITRFPSWKRRNAGQEPFIRSLREHDNCWLAADRRHPAATTVTT